MNHIHYQYVKSPCGELILASYDEKLCMCDWRYRSMRDRIDRRIKHGLNARFLEKNNQLIEHAIDQLDAYFNAKRKVFDIPLLVVGTAFQENVWRGLSRIPFGETTNYLQLAENIGCKKSVRAVASAIGANALSIMIPCHRVIGSNGQLIGYAGGLDVKKKLLDLEYSVH